MTAKHLSMNHRILEWFELERTSKNHLVHSLCCGPGHLSFGQVAQIPIQEQPTYTSFEPQFSMKTGCLSLRWFPRCVEFVFTLSFYNEITQELSLYTGYYPIPPSAKPQCLKEQKLCFEPEQQDRQKNPSLANMFLISQGMWVENKPVSPATQIEL